MRFLRKLMIGLGVLAAVPLAAQGPVQQIAVRGYQFPRIAAVVRPVQPGFLAPDERPDAV